uniref:Ribosomal protein L16 n=1 Tax=Thraustochytrium aureum TaxID=42467 RepID=Q9G4C5_9STRA|nr:ribosomal protein L16 [Thraustochytrium aureum]
MKLRPKNTSFTKSQRKKRFLVDLDSSKICSVNKLTFGSMGLMLLEDSFIQAKHFKIAYDFLKKNISKRGLFWILKFPDQSFTKKPLGSRIGKGKGNVAFWAIFVNKGNVFIEIESDSYQKSILLLKKLEKRFPFSGKIISN